MARNKFNIDEELDVPFNWEQFRRSLTYIKKYWKQFAAMFSLSLLASFLSLLAPKIQAHIIDRMIPAKLTNWIIVLGAGYFIVNITTIFINRARSLISVKTSQSVITDMRTDVFTHLQKLGFDYYDSRPHGKILTRVINYVNNVSDFLTNGLLSAVLQLLSLILILGFMLSISVKMTLVVLAGLPLFLIYLRVTRPRQRKYRQKSANKQSNVTAYLSETSTA
jgi:ATP-binding cassette subfamily B protein